MIKDKDKRTFALKASYFGLIGNDDIEIESKKNQIRSENIFKTNLK